MNCDRRSRPRLVGRALCTRFTRTIACYIGTYSILVDLLKVRMTYATCMNGSQIFILCKLLRERPDAKDRCGLSRSHPSTLGSNLDGNHCERRATRY